MTARRFPRVLPATHRGFNGARQASVTIRYSLDGGDGLVAVRPYRSRRTYELPLSTVAQLVVERIIKAEVAEKRAARRKR